MVYEEPDLPHLTPPPPCRLDADGSTLQMRKLWLRKVQRFAEGHWAGLRVDIGTSSSNRELAGALPTQGQQADQVPGHAELTFCPTPKLKRAPWHHQLEDTPVMQAVLGERCSWLPSAIVSEGRDSLV